MPSLSLLCLVCLSCVLSCYVCVCMCMFVRVRACVRACVCARVKAASCTSGGKVTLTKSGHVTAFASFGSLLPSETLKSPLYTVCASIHVVVGDVGECLVRGERTGGGCADWWATWAWLVGRE